MFNPLVVSFANSPFMLYTESNKFESVVFSQAKQFTVAPCSTNILLQKAPLAHIATLMKVQHVKMSYSNRTNIISRGIESRWCHAYGTHCRPFQEDKGGVSAYFHVLAMEGCLSP